MLIIVFCSFKLSFDSFILDFSVPLELVDVPLREFFSVFLILIHFRLFFITQVFVFIPRLLEASICTLTY